MILKDVKPNVQPFTLKGYSTVYRVVKHFSFNNTSEIEVLNSGRTVTVPSDKVIELVPLETL